MRAIILLVFASSSITSASAYSCGWIHSNQCRKSTSARYRSNSRIPTNAGPLFSSNGNGDDVPDISATQTDVDFKSVHDINWGEMDPFDDISFDDFEAMYIEGKSKDDDSLSKKNPKCDASYESIMTEWDDSVPTLNHISLVGRVGNAPEARYFDNPLGGGNNNSNKPNVVVTMSLALPRYYSAWEREQEGIQYGQEETEWYNLEVWGYQAEWALKHVQKGTRLGVQGSIDTDFYRNKNTDMLSTNPKLLVQDLDILESKMEADSRRGNDNNYNSNNYNNNNNKSSGNNNYNGGGSNYNSNTNYNNNNDNNYGSGQRREQDRGPSFFKDDDDEDDVYDPNKGGSAGGFFDS